MISSVASPITRQLLPPAYPPVNADRIYHGTPPDDPLWTEPGKVVGQTASYIIRDLGQGIRRVQYSDNVVSLEGRTINGHPVVEYKEGNNLGWEIEHDDAADRQAAEAALQAGPVTASTLPLEGGGMRVEWASGTLQAYRLTLPDARVIKVASDQPLTSPQLSHIGQDVLDAPHSTFQDLQLISVVSAVGQGINGKAVGLLGGYTDEAAGQIVLVNACLTDPTLARQCLWHEGGHLQDYHHRSGDRVLSAGQPVFGTGTEVKGEDGTVDLGRSSYVSDYAASNATEDFAETHFVVLDAWYRYKHHLIDAAPDQWTGSSGIAPALQEKFKVIEGLYPEIFGTGTAVSAPK